ncbi:DNA damage-regulated autophagy modulator protein 1 [Lampris incognitus]|uniref:DNA damage-regulated autophagy modulator protein 1 n=1 Tax=Lampris incognitus TaxID=2546036 RepID=UPI0024B5F002|nr:DNA damage-regulated autophagy modulator protein 1 [Lampris incognitus]
MLWFMQGTCFLPVFLVIWSSSTFIVPYIIALYRADVDVIFPYISDSGTYPPESCIFGLMTFVTATTALATMYARYKFVEKLLVVPPLLNKAAIGLGTLSCLGMCFVGTFQETAVTYVHDAGALLFFSTGVLYAILQCFISIRTYPYWSSLTVCLVRMLIATIALIAVFPMVIFASFVHQTTLHRAPTDEDYLYHLISAVSEWIAAFSFVCFFLTYISDFKLFTLQVKAEVLGHS